MNNAIRKQMKHRNKLHRIAKRQNTRQPGQILENPETKSSIQFENQKKHANTT